MPFHRCAVCEVDGRMIAKEVTVMIEETTRHDAAEWYGTISVTHLTSLEAGRRYRLVLDDGRSGEFLVRRNTFAGDTNRSVAIHGAGPLR